MNEERRKILKMVEDGMLSSEEAEELFESVDKTEQAANNPYSISEKVNWEERPNEYQGNSREKGTAAKLLGYLEEAFTKIKNVDLDLNFGNFYSISHVFQMNDTRFSKMDIDIANGNVQIVPWDEDVVRIACEAKVYQVNNQEEARQKFLEQTDFSIDDGILHFIISTKQVKVDTTIRIPTKFYEKVSLHLFNGSINVEYLKGKQLRTKTTNGSIDLHSIEMKTINAQTVNGKLKGGNLLADTIEAETISGSVYLVGDVKKVDAQVVNGSIHCTWHRQPEIAFLKATTGSIRLHVPEDSVIDGKLETNIGNLHCNLTNYKIYAEKKDMVKRALHFETEAHQKEQVFHLEAETKTGSIWIIPHELT
ncbi:DUF4097 family beta strand repeat-containing protein [Aquibacillus salsiterrae]|uniref:DUF4097 family beta strand repeat-containing protein n=1 Tax=Aquibacillus salsiterrae TaxID=2950439 RepID=A0A9X3WD03_9BACI|nr:DUF4097 domain-containing protein [Aquibacillus salsiterrae]MDC3416151.1 DUF4097 family beta strand repeat-containing protein [Aquibacillus salsiterrae]